MQKPQPIQQGGCPNIQCICDKKFTGNLKTKKKPPD